MRESRRVEGGSVYSVHVLFVNHPTGKRDTWLYSSQSTQGYKARSGGRVGVEREVILYVHVCMEEDGVLERWRQRHSERTAGQNEQRRTKEGGNLENGLGGVSFFMVVLV